jgi:inhibitor of KinA
MPEQPERSGASFPPPAGADGPPPAEASDQVRIRAAGDRALVVEFGKTIATALHDRVVALDQALTEAQGRGDLPGVSEWVPTYRSVMVCYEPVLIRARDLRARLRKILAGLRDQVRAERLWHVPVLYGHEAGLDLEDLAAMKGLSCEALIALHASVDYRVYMIGFSPGFTYLGGLPEALHTPRLAVPRQMTPGSGIAIGGAQACIGAQPGPSGWRFLGRTPLKAFDPQRTEPFVFRPGDRVRFHAIDPTQAARLDVVAATGAVCADLALLTAAKG